MTCEFNSLARTTTSSVSEIPARASSSASATLAAVTACDMTAMQLNDALFGERSLTERFGQLEGRELQTKIWESYMVPKLHWWGSYT